MNLADELGSDLAVAFLVDKKYSKKLNPKEVKTLLRKIGETLRPDSVIETDAKHRVAPKTASGGGGAPVGDN